MSKHERRKARTRRSLQDAAIELLTDKHYSEITVRDVIDHADIGRTTFYLHFNDMGDLWASCAERVIDEMTESFASHSVDSLLTTPEFGIKITEHIAQNRHLFSQLLGKEGLPTVIHRFHQYNAQMIARTLSQLPQMQDRQNDIPMIANMMAGARLGMHLWWLNEDIDPDPDTLNTYFQAVMGAILDQED